MRAFGVLLLAAVAGAAPWKEAGPHAVDTVATLKLDALEVRLTFPREEGKYPVVVFSHGMYGSKDGYAPLARFWASHGYVVLQPTHPDSLRAGGAANPERAWDVRPRQVSFLIDALPRIEKEVPALKGRLDAERIGVGGHSFGAHTAQLIGGVTAYAPLAKSFRDERVKAVLLISPQGRGGLFREDSWKTLAVPALVITGSKDTGRKGETPEWRLDPYQLSPAGPRYLVWIEGAWHGFGGISGVRWAGAGPENGEQVKIVQQASLAFFDAFVREDAKARAWLDAGEVAKTDEAEVRAENRLPKAEPAPGR